MQHNTYIAYKIYSWQSMNRHDELVNRSGLWFGKVSMQSDIPIRQCYQAGLWLARMKKGERWGRLNGGLYGPSHRLNPRLKINTEFSCRITFTSLQQVRLSGGPCLWWFEFWIYNINLKFFAHFHFFSLFAFFIKYLYGALILCAAGTYRVAKKVSHLH